MNTFRHNAPCNPDPALSMHALLWVDLAKTGNGRSRTVRLMARALRMYCIAVHPSGKFEAPALARWDGGAGIDGPLSHWLDLVGRGTLWLVRGWTDLVCAGLTDAIDAGQFTWRYLTIDGARVIGRGLYRGRPLALTSLAAFTGPQWDEWAPSLDPVAAEIADASTGQWQDVCRRPGTDAERTALCTWLTCLRAPCWLGLGNHQLSMGAQARQWWRCWAGPRIKTERPPPAKRKKAAPPGPSEIVGPLLRRPDPARRAERHVAVGLAHEQYGRGHVGGMVYEADMTAAYLQALVCTRLPLCYERGLSRIAPATLCGALDGRVALALVLVDSPSWPITTRRHGRGGRGKGRLWTWLCGDELECVLGSGLVKQVERAWIWRATTPRDGVQEQIQSILDAVKSDVLPGLAPYWRGLYAARVGAWAQWARSWVDAPRPTALGPWAAWTAEDRATGEIVRWRSIAGRTQRRRDEGDAPHALPLAYGCITAWVRLMMDGAASTLGRGNVLAVCADALWITEEGAAALQSEQALGRPWARFFRLKQYFDDVWMDGQGRAVVERDGVRWPKMIGIPTTAEIDPQGRSTWQHVLPWTADAKPSWERGVGAARARFDTERFVRENSGALAPSCPWIEYADGLPPEELLQPIGPQPPEGGPDHAA